jgi:hypothetical protein
MLASAATHLSELFVFPFSPPLVVVTLFGFAFLTLGILLLRDGTRVLGWGAILPLVGAFLGTSHSIRIGSMHPLTVWHVLVDLVVSTSCIYLIRRRQTAGVRAA